MNNELKVSMEFEIPAKGRWRTVSLEEYAAYLANRGAYRAHCAWKGVDGYLMIEINQTTTPPTVTMKMAHDGEFWTVKSCLYRAWCVIDSAVRDLFYRRRTYF